MNEPEDKLRSALTSRADSIRVGDPRPGVKERVAVHRRRRHRRVALGSAALVLVVAAGVLVPVLSRSDHSNDAPVAAARTGELKSKLVRDTRPTVSAAAVKQLVTANTETAIDLYDQLGKTPGNVFFSPYSITTALTMAAAGARGQTLAQMLAVLHDRLPQNEVHDATNALNLALLAPRPLPDTVTGNPLELEVANSLWGQAGFSIEPSFLDLLARDYGAALNTVDYEHANEAAVAAINAWVDAHTNHMIPNLLSSIDPATLLTLVNAVHFKGSWATPFVPTATSDGPFSTAAGHTVTVPYMHRDSSDTDTLTSYASGAGWQAVDLPYVGDASMTVIVPSAGTVDAFDRSLDASEIATIETSMRPAEVDLAFPKFTLDDKSSLGPLLENLGMKDAFGPNADFSEIDGRRDLAISQVIHEARVRVDEQGTEAAAATATGLSAVSRLLAPTITLSVDRPFVVVIRDTKTGSILFMGRITDPTQASAQQP